MLRVLYLGTRNDAHSHDNVHARVPYNTYRGDLHVETPSSAVKIEHYGVCYELNGAASGKKWIHIFNREQHTKLQFMVFEL